MELRIPVHSRADPLLGASRGVDPICIGCKERTSNSSSLGVNTAQGASTSLVRTDQGLRLLHGRVEVEGRLGRKLSQLLIKTQSSQGAEVAGWRTFCQKNAYSPALS